MKDSILPYIQKELIGVIGNRPLFKVINADISKIPFKISNRTLIIGDGKEFPLLIVKDALKAMYHYILTNDTFDFKNVDFIGDLGITDKQILQKIVFDHDTKGHFIVDDFSEFEFEEFQNLFEFKEHNFKDWLHIVIGEFIWFELNSITDFVTFSSYDYFEENYLEKATLKKKYDIVFSSPEEITTFKELFAKNKTKINYQRINNKEDEKIFNDLIAGNSWNLDDVYYLFFNNSR